MKINLLDLPKQVYDNLPLSIKILKDVYDYDELPYSIQYELKEILHDNTVNYTKGFDVKAEISKYKDLEVIETISDLILERLKNYFLTAPNEYPFNCVIGCQLKYHLQSKDTQFRKLLIDTELSNIVDTIKSDLPNHNINVNDVKINKKELGGNVEYNLIVVIDIDNTMMNLTFSI